MTGVTTPMIALFVAVQAEVAAPDVPCQAPVNQEMLACQAVFKAFPVAFAAVVTPFFTAFHAVVASPTAPFHNPTIKLIHACHIACNCAIAALVTVTIISTSSLKKMLWL